MEFADFLEWIMDVYMLEGHCCTELFLVENLKILLKWLKFLD
jgi:hypothetical protein